MVNVSKLKKTIILGACLLLCSNNAVFSMIHELKDEKLQILFPNVINIDELKRVSEEESQQRLQVRYDAHKKVHRYETRARLAIAGGQELLGLTSIHREILLNCCEKNVLDIGSATGLMASKIALNAKTVQTVEYSTTASDFILMNAKRHLPLVNKMGKIKVLNADFLSEGVNPGPYYDIISALNFLHYLTPSQAIVALKKCEKALKNDNSRLYICMNAPSPHQAVRDFYFKERDSGVVYPGHISMTWDSRANRTTRSTTSVSDISHSPDDSLFEPSMQEEISRIETPDLIQVVSRKAFFYGDTASMEQMCAEAGLSIVEMYYENSRGQKFLDLTPEIANRCGDNGIILCVIAKKS